MIDTDNPSQVEEDLRIIMAKHRNEGSIQHQKQHITSNDINIGAEGPQGKRARTDGNSGRDVRPDALLAWLSKQVEPYSEVGVKPVTDMTTSFQVLFLKNVKVDSFVSKYMFSSRKYYQ